jgi:hypothetical protein
MITDCLLIIIHYALINSHLTIELKNFGKVCKQWNKVVIDIIHDINKAVKIIDPNFFNTIELLKLTRVAPTPETANKLTFSCMEDNRKFQIFYGTYRPHIWINIDKPTIEEICKKRELFNPFFNTIVTSESRPEKFYYVYNLFIEHKKVIRYDENMFDIICDFCNKQTEIPFVKWFIKKECLKRKRGIVTVSGLTKLITNGFDIKFILDLVKRREFSHTWNEHYHKMEIFNGNVYNTLFESYISDVSIKMTYREVNFKQIFENKDLVELYKKTVNVSQYLFIWFQNTVTYKLLYKKETEIFTNFFVENQKVYPLTYFYSYKWFPKSKLFTEFKK